MQNKNHLLQPEGFGMRYRSIHSVARGNNSGGLITHRKFARFWLFTHMIAGYMVVPNRPAERGLLLSCFVLLQLSDGLIRGSTTPGRRAGWSVDYAGPRGYVGDCASNIQDGFSDAVSYYEKYSERSTRQGRSPDNYPETTREFPKPLLRG